MKNFSIKRIVTDAVLIAIFYALSLFSIEISGVKISFASLPVVISAMIFGPVDGFLVGFLGEFLTQMLKYGFTATTILWILPPALRGLVIGLSVRLFKNRMSLDALTREKKPHVYFAVCILAAVITSLSNTFVYYIDSKLYGYYNYALIWGVAGVRILTNILQSVLTAIIAIPVLLGLRRARLIPAPKTVSD